MGPENELTVEIVGKTLIVEPGPRVSALSGGNFAARRRQLVEEISESNLENVLVDLRNVEVLGSVLLDTLCVMWKCVRPRSGQLLLCNLSEFAHDVLKVARLNQLWPAYASREEALNTLKPAHSAHGSESTRDEAVRAACQP